MFDYSLLLGDTLEKPEGPVETNNLNGLYVGLYFAASWCGMCRQFTSIANKAYALCKAQNKPLEIVCISRDVNKENYDTYRSKLPWYSVPYEKEELREQLCRHFSVTSLPFFVILNPEGQIINLNARQLITENIYGFPWREMSIYEHLEPYIQQGNTHISIKEIQNKPLLLLFSASWSHACHKFVSRLLELYNKLIESKHELSVVMCCGDKKENEYNNYVSKFPWIHIGFACQEFKNLLSKYNISGYPSCVIFDKDGVLCQVNAVETLINENALENYPWLPQPVSDANEDPEGINNYPSIILLCDKTNDINPQETEKDLQILKECGEEGLRRKEYFRLKYFYANKDSGVSQQIRQLTKVSQCPALLLLHLPDRGSFYLPKSQDITKENIISFVNDFMSNKLQRQQAVSI